MSKRKILSLAMALSIVAIMAVGATLAYFTDTDEATNTFVVGNVQITLNEKERNPEATDGLQGFTNNQHLYPIVGSAQFDTNKTNMDSFGMVTGAENYIDKMVTVTNNGSEEAWVRAYFAIPSILDDGYDQYNASMNVLHFNFGSKLDGTTTYGNEWIWKHEVDGTEKWNYYETTIEGIAYNVYFADYKTTVAGNTTTERLLNGVYLDSSFNYDGENYYIVKEGQKKTLTLPEGWNWNAVDCPVFAVAVQAAGFANADAAVTEAFGAQYNPFGGTATNWQ